MTQPITHCPFLGLTGDRTVVRSAPDPAHRCYAQQPVGAPDLAYQTATCMAGAHLSCPFFLAPAPAAPPLAPRRAGLLAALASRRWLPWAALALLLVAVIATYAWEARRLPARVPPAGATALPVQPAQPPSAAPPTVPPATATATAQPARPPGRFATPTAEPGGRVLTLAPRAGDAGWWTSGEARGSHLGDSFLYAGFAEGQAFLSAVRFDLGPAPRGAAIRSAVLRLAGLKADRFAPAAGGVWTVQLLPADALPDLARADFQALFNAPAAVTLFPTLFPADLAAGSVNTLALDAAAQAWLADQIAASAPAILARIVGPGGGDTLFAWDSGAGPATAGEPPQLVIAFGPPPATPPSLPTEAVIIATLTPTPANILTVAAQIWTATADAAAHGTPTSRPYRIITPTPIPENLATAQALGFARGLPPIVASTPTPATAATATYQALYATAVAVTTGTFTPVPTDAVTPVVVLPTPVPQNVMTAAAQMRTATAEAAAFGTPTPLPFNAVIATRTLEPFVFLDTPVPANAATAQALAAYATAVAATTGTFTPLPPNAVRATRTPTPTPLPLVLYFDQLPPAAAPSPTPALPTALPRELIGKILFISDRDGAPALFALDPGNGRLAYVTQPWPYALALAREPRAPDGFRTAIVTEDDRRIPQVFVRDAQYKDALRQLTTVTGMSYDPAWSPTGDRIALVSEEPGNAEIYTIAADGSAFRRLTTNEWEWDKHPSWSPDGAQIVFWSNRETGRRQLWVMNADGANQRRLLTSASNDWDPIWVK